MGNATAVHQSIDARLGAVLGSPVLAALVNYFVGVCLLIMVWQIKLFVDPTLIEEGNRRRNTPLYQRAGGIFGAVFVVVGTFVIPQIGAASFAVSSIFASQLTSFLIDYFDVGFLLKAKPHLAQLLILAVSLAGVVLSSYDGLTDGSFRALPLLLAIAAGVCLPLQTLLNVLYSVHRNKFQAETQSFAVAFGVLLVTGGILLAVGDPTWSSVVDAVKTKSEWWQYMGGVIGAMLITLCTYAMPKIGVATLMLSLYSGIICGAAILDFTGVFFAAKKVTPERVAGVGVCGVATVLYAVAQHKLAKRPLDLPIVPPPSSSSSPDEAARLINATASSPRRRHHSSN